MKLTATINAKLFRMSQTASATLIVATSLISVASVATAAEYLNNFNSGPGGWFGEGLVWQASGGVADTGYFRGIRDGFQPNFGEVFQPSAAIYTLGNLEAVYGNLITFSYDAKVFQGPVNRPPSQVFFAPGGTTDWTKIVAPSIAPFQNDWTSVSFQVNTNWTDAEALANGWSRPFGTASWSATLHNVGAQEIFYQLQDQQFPGQTFITGIDNYRIVPEPSALVLTGLGLATLVRRRRGA